MVRFWFFAAFAIFLAARAPGGLRAAVASRKPKTQLFRGVLLALEICVMVSGLVLLGLLIFGETLRSNVVIGAGVVVAAGLFTLWRQRVRASQG